MSEAYLSVLRVWRLQSAIGGLIIHVAFSPALMYCTEMFTVQYLVDVPADYLAVIRVWVIRICTILRLELDLD